MNKVLYDAALWREHDGWVTYKCNVEQMPRYAMLEAYGSPPIEKAIQAALDAAYAEGRRDGLLEAADCVPKHLRNVRALMRLRADDFKSERLTQQAEGGAHGTHEQG